MNPLGSLRALFDGYDIGIYLILSQDEHQSEFTAPADNRRAYVSNFTGSAGIAIVTRTKAALATDGRYFLQAERQLSKEWILLKQRVAGAVAWRDWAVQEAIELGHVNIGVDLRLIMHSEVLALNRSIMEKNCRGSLLPIDVNLVDMVWPNKPVRSQSPVQIHDLRFAGEPVSKKLTALKQYLGDHRGGCLVVSALDEIAWLLNLRGTDDIPYNPVFFAYLIVTAQVVTLFIDPAKLEAHVREHLVTCQVETRDYTCFYNALKQYSTEKRPAIVATQSSWAVYRALDNVQTVDVSPIAFSKSVKNNVEIAGARECQLQDGAALVQFFKELQTRLDRGERLTDWEAGDLARQFRSKQPNFVGLSFATICASGADAAVIHYEPDPSSDHVIDPKHVFLLDSGGQYHMGTTDTTRTWHFGTPSAREQQAYTLVLKGHIALARAVFPVGTTGAAVEVLARQFLWSHGLNYLHGTGHGVGSYLNVHEGPMGIGSGGAVRDIPLKAGNVLSNEPGYYEAGEYGIRIENVVVVRAHEQHSKFLCFETLTCVPLCLRLVDRSLLTTEEITWINEYHEFVRANLEARLDSEALKWLLEVTSGL